MTQLSEDWKIELDSYTHGSAPYEAETQEGKKIYYFLRQADPSHCQCQKKKCPKQTTVKHHCPRPQCNSCRKSLNFLEGLRGPQGNVLDAKILGSLTTSDSKNLCIGCYQANPNVEAIPVFRPPDHVVRTNSIWYGQSREITESILDGMKATNAIPPYSHIPVTSALDQNDEGIIQGLEQLIKRRGMKHIRKWLEMNANEKEAVGYMKTLANALDPKEAKNFSHLSLPASQTKIKHMREFMTLITEKAPNGFQSLTEEQKSTLILSLICPSLNGAVCHAWKAMKHLTDALETVSKRNSGGINKVLKFLNARFDPASYQISRFAEERKKNNVKEARLENGTLSATCALAWGMSSPDEKWPPMPSQNDLDLAVKVFDKLDYPDGQRFSNEAIVQAGYQQQKKTQTSSDGSVKVLLNIDDLGRPEGTCVENITVTCLLEKMSGPIEVCFAYTVFSCNGGNPYEKYVEVETVVPQPDGTTKRYNPNHKCSFKGGTEATLSDPSKFRLVSCLTIDPEDYLNAPIQSKATVLTEKERQKFKAKQPLLDELCGGVIKTSYLVVPRTNKTNPPSEPTTIAELIQKKPKGLPRLPGLSKSWVEKTKIDVDNGWFAAILQHNPQGGILPKFCELVVFKPDGTCTVARNISPNAPRYPIPDSCLPHKIHGDWKKREYPVVATISTGTSEVPGPSGTFYCLEMNVVTPPSGTGRGLHPSNPAFKVTLHGEDVQHSLRHVISTMNTLGTVTNDLVSNHLKETPCIGVWIPATTP